jgi:hypothetical protein
VPATLTFVYEDAEIPAGTTADDLRWAGVANGQWVGLETTHDVSARMLTAEATHFSTYGAGMFPNNEPPTLLISEPASDMLVSYGGMVQIEYTDDDPDDGAATWLFADKDGDLDTIDDTIVRAHVRPERDGSRQRVVWCAADAQTPPGIYHLMGATWDGTDPASWRARSRGLRRSTPPPRRRPRRSWSRRRRRCSSPGTTPGAG